YDYGAEILYDLREEKAEDYIRAAELLNDRRFDVASLQHEFGIFGGESGAHVLKLMSRLSMPVVTTLHTVLKEPTSEQRLVLERVIDLSAKVVVMAEKGRTFLRDIYGAPDEKIAVIPHGIPDVQFPEPEAIKNAYGFSGRPVILTFGLLSPN